MRRILVLVALSALAGLAGCADKNPYAPAEKPAPSGPPPKLAGQDPDKFECKSFLSEAEVGQAVGGAVTWTPADMPSSPGTPAPCVYVLNEQPQAPDAGPQKRGGPDAGPEPSKGISAWQYHLDCRPVAVGDAQAIIRQMLPMADSKEIKLGRGAVDHSNARIVAVDDDTECAAYVVGPEQAIRERLTAAVLLKLNASSMPKLPRAM
jgi:hypothetical protein